MSKSWTICGCPYLAARWRIRFLAESASSFGDNSLGCFDKRLLTLSTWLSRMPIKRDFLTWLKSDIFSNFKRRNSEQMFKHENGWKIEEKSHAAVHLKSFSVVDLGSISSKFYTQLLPAQVQKVQKDSKLKRLFALLVSAGHCMCKSGARKHIDEIDPWSICWIEVKRTILCTRHWAWQLHAAEMQPVQLKQLKLIRIFLLLLQSIPFLF